MKRHLLAFVVGVAYMSLVPVIALIVLAYQHWGSAALVWMGVVALYVFCSFAMGYLVIDHYEKHGGL